VKATEGGAENHSGHLGPKTAQAATKQQHYSVITERNLAEVFRHGAYELTRAEAAKLLELLTVYTALRAIAP
jgi:hypothetical protein